MARFMVDYEPFIEHLESGGTFSRNEVEFHNRKEGDGKDPYDWELMEKTMEPLVFEFAKECFARFEDVPFLGALQQLEVVTVHGEVRIEEYDGYESYEERDSYDGWL